jgi:uncharacterized protein
MDQRVVRFYSEGCRLEADYYLPTGGATGGRRPGIVLCHGYSGIRKLILPDYAKIFVEAGYVALAFDYRGFGGSEGEKHRIVPLEQVDDIRSAITWLAAQPEVDASRIGLWGTSYGGAHVPYVAGIDARVRAAVGQVGFGDGERLLMEIRTEKERADLLRKIEEDRVERALHNRTSRADVPTILASAQTRDFFAAALPNFPDLEAAISWESAEKTMEYKPIEVVERIAPRALLLIGAEKDDLCKFEGYRALHARAKEPKKIVGLPITHYEIYTEKWVPESGRLAVEWYDRHLRG